MYTCILIVEVPNICVNQYNKVLNYTEEFMSTSTLTKKINVILIILLNVQM